MSGSTSNLLRPGAAPARPGNAFGRKQRALTGCVRRFAFEQDAGAAALACRVGRVFLLVGLRGIGHVTHGQGSGVAVPDHLCALAGLRPRSVPRGERTACCSGVNKKCPSLVVHEFFEASEGMKGERMTTTGPMMLAARLKAKNCRRSGYPAVPRIVSDCVKSRFPWLGCVSRATREVSRERTGRARSRLRRRPHQAKCRGTLRPPGVCFSCGLPPSKRAAGPRAQCDAVPHVAALRHTPRCSKSPTCASS